MDKSEFTISIEQPKLDFINHLSLKGNKRIIFSGPFGTGKTYFLDRFFKENASNYECVFLCPVHYAVAKNEDIFELIKYDIFFELICNEKIEIDFSKFSNRLYTEFILAKNTPGLTAFFAENVSKVGKAILPVLKQLEPLLQNTLKGKAQYEEVDFDRISTYLKKIEKTKGSIKEQDAVTEMIRVQIDQLRAPTEKETVLIIDDLDRIDPDHIFRLLNVFATHLDPKFPNENKFGFDKVIFVCDIENIRNIFQARYGSNVDFSGYIDKFYSIEEFTFDNRFAIQREVKSILTSIQITEEDKSYFNLLDTSNNQQTMPKLVFFVSEFILSGALNIRKLRRLRGTSFTIANRMIRFNGFEGNFSSTSFVGILELDFLRRVCGSLSDLREAFRYFGNRNPIHLNSVLHGTSIFQKRMIEDFLLIKARSYHQFGLNTSPEFDVNLYEYGAGLKCKIYRNDYNDTLRLEVIGNSGAQMTPPKTLLFHDFVVELIDDLKREHILK
ncbi:MAG TPA: P-loop NTPase fold protein [Chitinophagales bacterium]|nr:P-loop NTPase fold protein [Chitinophagales bacterium]